MWMQRFSLFTQHNPQYDDSILIANHHRDVFNKFSAFVQLVPTLSERQWTQRHFYKAHCLKVICFPWVGLTGLDSRGPRPQTPQGGVEKENIRAKMKLSNSLTRFPKNQEINTCQESCVKVSRVHTVGHTFCLGIFSNETKNNFKQNRLVVNASLGMLVRLLKVSLSCCANCFHIVVRV